MIRILEPLEAAERWPEFAAMINRVFERFDYGYNTDDVLFEVVKGQKQVWDLGGTAVAITEVCVLPRFKVLDIPLLAGDDIDEWLADFVEALHVHARVNGCKYVDGFGRKGWTRKLEKFGFRPYSYDVRLEVRDGR